MSAKTFTPSEVPDVPDTSKVEQAPPKVAPTLEQITAIKVIFPYCCLSIEYFYLSFSYLEIYCLVLYYNVVWF